MDNVEGERSWERKVRGEQNHCGDQGRGLMGS